MKKSTRNTIKFWVWNRFTWLGVLITMKLIILGVIGNPYLNAVMFVLLLFLILGVWSNLIEERNANSSERLMWQKYSNFIDRCK